MSGYSVLFNTGSKSDGVKSLAIVKGFWILKDHEFIPAWIINQIIKSEVFMATFTHAVSCDITAAQGSQNLTDFL